MAVSPQTKKRATILKRVEAKIDSYLKRGDGGRETIAVSLMPDGFCMELWEELEPKYKAAGWRKAEYVSDQRDGDFLDFEP